MLNFKSILLTVSLIIVAFSASAAPTNPFEKLMREVGYQTVFRQTTSDANCPRFITPFESSNLPAQAQKGDQAIYLSGNTHATRDAGSFTYEGNRMIYRPNLERGITHRLYWNLTFPDGVAYFATYQTIKDGFLIYELWQKVVSFTKVETSYFKIAYDSYLDTIQYTYSDSNEREVNCSFSKMN